jgi:hypothetical protein
MKKATLPFIAFSVFLAGILLAINSNWDQPLPDKWWVDDSYRTFFLSLVILIWPWIYNHAIDESQKVIKSHWRRFVIRGVIGFVIALLYAKFDLAKTLPLTMFIGAYFWLSFDILYNIARGNSLFYVGRTALLDKLTYNIPRFAVLFKLLLIVESIIWFLNT